MLIWLYCAVSGSAEGGQHHRDDHGDWEGDGGEMLRVQQLRSYHGEFDKIFS
jgi:hypothetical protein